MNIKKLMKIMTEEAYKIEEANYLDKTFYLFDRHRITFLCWARAFKEGLINKGNTLITLDAHSDFFTEKRFKEDLKLVKEFDFKTIKKHINNKKQDWIVRGMETGI